MNKRKIIGITVGTPINPQVSAEKANLGVQVFQVEYSDKKTNKTYDEVVQAYSEGQIVVLNDIEREKVFYLSSISSTMIVFTNLEGVNYEGIFLMPNNFCASTSWKIAQQPVLDKKQDIIERIEKTTEDTIVAIEPNKLYVFPTMPSLTYSIVSKDSSKLEEFHFIFQSGETPTAVIHPEEVNMGDFKVEANKIYEVSIIEGLLISQSWVVE